MPDDRTILVERFRDELGDWRVAIHSPFGAQVRAMGVSAAARLRERYGVNVQAMHSDDGIVLRLPDTEDDPPAELAVFEADEIERLVTDEVGGSALFAARFRECAPGPCCCRDAIRAGVRRCGSSVSGRRNSSRSPASTARSPSCWRRCASASRTCSTFGTR